MARRLLGGVAVLELVMIALLGYGYYRWTIEYRGSDPVTGELLAHRQTDDGRYYVTYRFEADGLTYTHERRVTKAWYEGTQDGQPVPVVYSPIDPEVSGIPGQGISDTELPRIPGTFFSFRFLAYYLPIALVANTFMLLGLSARVRRRKRSDAELIQATSS